MSRPRQSSVDEAVQGDAPEEGESPVLDGAAGADGLDKPLCTINLVPPTAVAGACTTAAATAAFLAVLTQSTGQQIVQSISGVAAKALSSQRGSRSAMYALLCGVAPPLLQHNLKNLRCLHPILIALVRQAQADEQAGAMFPTAASPLADLLDRLVASANKREDVLRHVRDSWFSAADVVVVFQEVIDGNAAHRHNVRMLTSLMQGAALCASPEDHAKIVRLVAEWLHQQLTLNIEAVERRLAWMSSVPASTTSFTDRVLHSVSLMIAKVMDLRTRWRSLVL